MFLSASRHLSLHVLPILVAALFLLGGCSATVKPPTSAPPPVVKPPPQQRPVTRPVVRQPAAPRPRVKKPTKVPVAPVVPVVRPDKPEEGKNPYDDIPRRTVASAADKPASAPAARTSPAVKSLLTRAKANLLAKRTASAISKLERALRIEPRNPAIWHQLARAHYQEGKDSQAISMAQKSNLYADEGSDLEKANWQLIKKAAKRSGQIKVLKEAIRYERTHP